MFIDKEITIPGADAAPTLELRSIVLQDLVGLTPVDREVVRYLAPRFAELAIALSAGDGQALHWLETVPDGAFWGIFDISDDKGGLLIGYTGLHTIETVDGREHHSRSVGVVIDPAYQGRGVATRTHPFRTWHGFDERNLDYVTGIAARNNTRSKRAVEVAGYVALGPIDLPVPGATMPATLLRQFNPRLGLETIISLAQDLAAELGNEDLDLEAVKLAYERTAANLSAARQHLAQSTSS